MTAQYYEPQARYEEEFFQAAANYDVVRLEAILANGYVTDINRVRRDGKSAIHVLFQDEVKGHLKEAEMLQCLRVLLRYNCDVNFKDTSTGECPLIVAVDNGFESCAVELVKHGADTCMRTTKYSGKHGIATRIAEKMPRAMLEILDKGVDYEDQSTKNSDAPLLVKLDWGPIVQYPKRQNDDPVPRETSFLYSLVGIRPSKTLELYLSHPLVLAFVFLKNRKIMRRLLLFQLLMLLYPLLYMIFAYFLYFDICKFSNDNDEDEETTTVGTVFPYDFDYTYEKQSCEMTAGIVLSAFLLASVLIVHTAVEIYMFMRMDKTDMKNWRTWVTRGTIIIMGLTLWPPLSFKSVYRISWQYPIAAIGIFFGWVNFLISMENLFEVQMYLEMVVHIILSVLKITALFLPLFAGFYMGFHLIFEETGNIMNFILMAIGGATDQIKEMMESVKDGRTWFTMMSYFFFLIFLVVISIVFINFLLGMSIDDIQRLKRKAKTMALSNEVQNMYLIDLLLPLKIQQVVNKNIAAGMLVHVPCLNLDGNIEASPGTGIMTADVHPEETWKLLPEDTRSKLTKLLKDRVNGITRDMNTSEYDDGSDA